MNKPVYRPRKVGDLSMSYYRNTSSAFGDKIKLYLLSTGVKLCSSCGSRENLTIDHIISVWLAHKYKMDIRELNNYANFQILCNLCNVSKSPNDYEWVLSKISQDRGPITISKVLTSIRDGVDHG